MSNKLHLELVKFAASKVPEFVESKETTDDRYVVYGGGKHYNQIPAYLLKLFNECGPHASIIENKSNYIIGDGLQYQDGTDLNFKVNASENVKELVTKVVKDYLIFNYFAIEVVYNVFGEPIEYHHVPAQKVRTNKSKTKFWYAEDWSNGKNSIVYDRWSLKNQDGTSKLFFFDGYFPSINDVYTRPEYLAAVESIETDIAIKAFNKNNIKNHFSPANIITFFMGSNVSEEQKEQTKRKLVDSYTGEHGEKVILDFQNLNGKSAEVKSLTAGDWDKAYAEVAKKVTDDIFIAHQITSPMLFGIKTEGQLGGATELETSFQIFKNTYVKVKRDALESALNLLFSNYAEYKGVVRFGDSPLFTKELDNSIKSQVMTINELRMEAGLKAIEGGDRLISEPAPVNANKEAAQKMIDSITALSPLVANKVLDQMTVNEIRSLGGLPPIEGGDQVATPSAPEPVAEEETDLEEVKKKSRKLTEEDYEQVKHLGSALEDFEILGEHQEQKLMFGAEEDVAKYVIENDIKHLRLDELSALLKKDMGVNVAQNELQDILDKLHDAGIIKVTIKDGKVNVMPNKTADVPGTGSVLVMYRYDKRPDVGGPDLLPTSRSFCVKLIGNNRLYTREEIQQMSGLFGYDVYQYAGGFYFNPDTQQTTSYCRHKWTALRVKRKQS